VRDGHHAGNHAGNGHRCECDATSMADGQMFPSAIWCADVGGMESDKVDAGSVKRDLYSRTRVLANGA
jgi:hypothetical protein